MPTRMIFPTHGPGLLFLRSKNFILCLEVKKQGRIQGEGARGAHPSPLPPEMTCGFLIQLGFCKKKKTMCFIGVEVEQETSAPPPKKNPGSAPEKCLFFLTRIVYNICQMWCPANVSIPSSSEAEKFNSCHSQPICGASILSPPTEPWVS